MGLKFHYRLFLVLFILNCVVIFAFNKFLNFAESQSCISLNDFLHPSFEAINLSSVIFSITYLPVIIFLITSIKKPDRLNFFAIAYILITATRIITIYIFPLCEPIGAIPLEDKLLNSIFYSNGYCGIDLFYSGHTATIFMLALILPNPFKSILIFLSLTLGTMLILQKVHYSIDIIAAFPITILCFYLTRKIYFLISKETYIAK